MTNIKATNRVTGEVIELQADTPTQIVMAWRAAQEFEKVGQHLKDQLKRLVPELVGNNGLSETIIDGFQFRISNVQRMNYAKSVMRALLDEDVFDVLIKPDKPAVDKYLKENLESLGDTATQLRQTMFAEGLPYQIIKLERTKRDE